MKRLNGMMGHTAAVLLFTLLAQTAAFAQIGPDPRAQARHNRIVGMWDVMVTVTNCAGVTVGQFPAVHQYDLGGTGQVVPATNPAGLSAHLLVWHHVGGNNYQMSMKMFRFDGAGNNIGWIVLTNEVSINEAATTYAGSGVATIYDSSGNPIGGSCPTFVGTRFSG